MAYLALASTFTVTGSLLSCLATLAVLLYCTTSGGRHTSLRHSLVVNLCLAEFLNSLNSSISGLIYVNSHETRAGPACVANGFYANMTAQAVDFTILTIVLGTLLTITRLIRLPSLSAPWVKACICSCTWILPLISSATAVASHALGPVGKNWCDLARTRTGLRWALADGWRLAILIFTIFAYAFIWWFRHSRRTLLPLAYRKELLPEKYTARNKTRLASTTSGPFKPRSSGRTSKRTSGLSSLSLPFQGYDASGVDFQERQAAIDSKAERISRWIYVRHPGLINSLKSPLPPAPSPIGFGPVVTKSVTIIRDDGKPELTTAVSSYPPTFPTWHYQHGQAPKAQQSTKASADRASSAVSSRTPVQDRAPPLPPRRILRQKSIVSADARTASSYDTVPWGLRCSSPTRQMQWPFLNSTSSPAASSRGSSSSGAVRGTDDKPPRQPSAALLEANEQLRILSATMKSQRDPFSPGAVRSREEAAEVSARPEHNSYTKGQGPLRACVCAVDDSRHRAYPKIDRSTKPPSDPPQKPAPSPKYHSRCPKVRKSIAVTTSEPIIPQIPCPTYRPPPLGNKTSIFSTTTEPSPLPTPGFPPPPWSTDSPKQRRRRTFLLSRSTWSDAPFVTHFPRAPDVGDAAARNDREVHRMLLLNAYTLAYVVLWLPWLVNAFMEARGSVPADVGAMATLVGVSQYLGLVHAATFAVNEGLRGRRRKREASVTAPVVDEKTEEESGGV